MNTMNVETLTLEGAKLAADVALSTAEDEGLAVCVAVVNATGNLVLVHRMDNVVEIALENAIAKAVAALTFKRDTGALSDYFQTDKSLGPPMTARHH
ncbi:MAG: heme-binding protein, partial [Acidimicrobiaceae bacterium]|nr:heme-binding protein [Acidimicrobiaceae bacterium]